MGLDCRVLVHTDVVHLVFEMILSLDQKDCALSETLLSQRNGLHVFDHDSKNLIVQQLSVSQEQQDVLLLEPSAL